MDFNDFSPESLRGYINNYKSIRIILTAYELELFTIIGNSGKNAEEIAKSAETQTHATSRLLNALCAFGLLTLKNGTYYNNESSLKYLEKSSPEYIYGLGHTVNQWKSWSILTEAVKTGICYNDRPINERNSEWQESFIGAMHYRAQVQANELAVCLDLENVKTMLDIGGGSGAFAMSMIKINKSIKATIFDLPSIIDISKKYIHDEGMEDCVFTISGNYHNDSFIKKYDLILLSAVVHINSFDENKKLIQKCADSLNPGGHIVIQDSVMGENRTTPTEGTILALNMLVATERGDTYTKNEIFDWINSCGMKQPLLRKTESNRFFITAKK